MEFKNMKKKDGRKNNGGHSNGGRKSREELGLPPLVTTSIKTEQAVIDKARKIHGTLDKALRYSISK